MPERDREGPRQGVVEPIDAGSTELARSPLSPDPDREPADSFAPLLREVARAVPARRLEVAPGERIGRFEVLGELGRGAFGVVVEAKDTALGRRVAIKILLREGPALAPRAERFRKEAEAVARLNHPNIVTLYDFGEWQGLPYLVLERLEGRALSQVLAEGPMPAREALAVLSQITRALAYAHARGVIHRDLKPKNVLVLEGGAAKILDFGLAELQEALSDGLRPPAGTPPYMAPEQWLGGRQDARTDLFNAGVMLFEMLSGALPFAVPGPGGSPEVLSPGRAPSIRERAPAAPDPLARLVDRAIAKDPAERFQSAEELLEALGEVERSLTEVDAGATTPYRYLEPFLEGDEARFFGRASEVIRIEQMLTSRALVAVAGPSGAGKTSLVRAGLLPRLRRAGWTVVTDLEPLLAAATGAARALAVRAAEAQGPVLLFVDALEGAFAEGSDPFGRSAALAQVLLSASESPDAPVRVLVAVREGGIAWLPEKLRERVLAGLLPLHAPARDALAQAVREPAERQGVVVEAAVVEEILAQLAGEGAPLPALQLAASELWEHRDGRRIGRGALDALGGLGGLLARHADEVLARLSAEEANLARRILTSLIGPGGSRHAAEVEALLSSFEDRARAARVLAHLVDERVLTAAKGEHGDEVRLAHPLLVGSWGRLATWLDLDAGERSYRARLAQATALWRSEGRPRDLLWRGQRLRDELRHHRSSVRVSADEREFLEASESVERRRRARLLAGAVLGAIALFGGAAAAILYHEHRLGEATRPAREEAKQARAAAVLQAAAAAKDPRTQALLLAEMDPDHEPPGGLRLALAVSEKMIPSAVLRGHRGAIHAVAASASRIVTGAADGTVRVWRADGAGDPLVLRHGGEVLAVALSRDGARLATGGDDRIARVWRLEGHGDPVVLRGHEDWVSVIAFRADGRRVVTGSPDGAARVWDAEGRDPPVVLRHRGPVTLAGFLPRGDVVTASEDGSVRVWDGATGRERRAFEGSGAVHAAALSADGARLAAGYADGTARVWRMDGGGPPIVLRGHTRAVRDVAFAPGGDRVATASDDGTARVWRMAKPGEPLVLRGHEGPVRSVSFRPDGRRVVTASADGTARFWRAGRPARSIEMRGHTAALAGAAFAQGGERVVTISLDGTARVWPGDGPLQPLIFNEPDERVPRGGWFVASAIWNARFSPDGTRVVTAEGSGIARIFRVDGRADPIVLKGHEDEVYDAAFSPDGEWVVTASRDRTARLWRADGTGEPVVLGGHARGVRTAEFSPDGRLVLTASRDGTARLFRVDAAGHALVLRGHEGELRRARFSPRGRRIVTAGHDGTARLWRAADGTLVAVLRSHEARLEDARFSPDGTRVVTASSDGTARISRADGSGEPVVLRGHKATVWRASFSPDGRQVLTAGGDGTVRVWESEGGREVRVLEVGQPAAMAAAWSLRGRRILAGGSEGALRMFPAEGPPTDLSGHRALIRAVRFSPSGKHLLSTDGGGTAFLWSRRGERQVLMRGPKAASGPPEYYELLFTHDGEGLVTTARDGTVFVWHSRKRDKPVPLKGHRAHVGSLALSPDGSMLATASWDGTARLWRLDGSAPPRVVAGHRGWVNHVTFSADGTRVATASADGTARIWSTDGKPERSLEGHTAGVMAVRIREDVGWIATASADSTARLWPVEGLRSPIVLRAHASHVMSTTFGEDGSLLLTTSGDRTARLWDVLRPPASIVLRGHTAMVPWGAFSRGGDRVVTASHDGTARVWAVDGRPLAVLRGHERMLWTALFSPGGRRVVTSSEDGTARVWRADGLGEPLVLRAGRAAVTHATFSPRGGRVAAASGDGSARIWHVTWPGVIRLFRGATRDCLAAAERVRLLGEAPDAARDAQAACERINTSRRADESGASPPP